MKMLQIEGTDLRVSNIIMGCMRINALSKKEAGTLIHTALEQGINLFDHADIYGGGECESLFADAVDMRPAVREKMVIQSKCSIHNGYFDFSKAAILEAADGILRRLRTDYLDILLLHRPDPLMEPEEVAEAFDILHDAGKVRYFGVSNQNSMQIELLQKYTRHRLIVDQLQMSVVHTPALDSGLAANMSIDQSIERTGSIYEYSRLKGITLQAWSPFQKGYFEGAILPGQGEVRQAQRGHRPPGRPVRGDEHRDRRCLADAPPRERAGDSRHNEAAAPDRELPRLRAAPHPPRMVRALHRRGQYPAIRRHQGRAGRCNSSLLQRLRGLRLCSVHFKRR